MDAATPTAADYPLVLSEYLRTHSEESLYRASLMSEALVATGLGPEDIVALHSEALGTVSGTLSPLDQLRAMNDAHQFLLEIMIGYGVHYREYLELKLSQEVSDLEARVQREQERLSEVERIGREKDEILAVIAHELRQPLTAAQSHLDLAERFLTRGEVERAPSHLVSVRQAIGRLSRLSADLVEASRNGPPALSLSMVALEEIVAQAVDWVTPVINSKGLSLESSNQTGSSVEIWGNADALLSVFCNLLSNALRYTDPGGKVAIILTTGENCAIGSVSDSGIGMSEEVQARIFEKFYRAPDAHQHEGHGLGLGLALVHQLVEAHRGHIEVQSTPGKGSTFRVVLPRGQDTDINKELATA